MPRSGVLLASIIGSLMASRDTTLPKLGSTCERAVMTAVQTYARRKLSGVCSSKLVKIWKKKGIYAHVKMDVFLVGASERECMNFFKKISLTELIYFPANI